MVKSISVALATYNGAAFIGQQLASIAQQDCLPAELVVTDDSSTDNTLELVAAFAAMAPFPVRVHRNETRLGYRANFMRALSLCGSELIALCDQDDVWEPNKLSVAQAAFDTPDTVLFFHNAWLIDRAGERIGPADIYVLPPRNPPLSAHGLLCPFGFSMVCASSLLRFSDLWDQSIDSNDQRSRMGHDQWMFFLAAIFGEIAYSDLRLTQYRQHGANAFGSPDRGFAAMLRHRFRWLTNHGAKYAALARAAHMRAAILAECQARLDGVWLDRAAAGERACLLLADRLAKRARLYGDASVWERARLVIGLYRGGAYATDRGFGLGREVLVKDLAIGIVLRRLLHPSHDEAERGELNQGKTVPLEG